MKTEALSPWLVLALSSFRHWGLISKDVTLLQCISAEALVTFLLIWEHLKECTTSHTRLPCRQARA